MVLLFILVFCALIALGFGGAAAWSDYTRMNIPNLYSIAIILSFIPAFAAMKFFAPDVTYFGNWQSHLITFVAVFAVTYVLFLLKFIGGGDSKLITAYALWTGFQGLMPFLFFMALIGGVLGLITLLLGKVKLVKKPKRGSWVAKAQNGKREVPYGIAIFTGAIIAFWQINYLEPETLISLVTQTTGS